LFDTAQLLRVRRAQIMLANPWWARKADRKEAPFGRQSLPSSIGCTPAWWSKFATFACSGSQNRSGRQFQIDVFRSSTRERCWPDDCRR